MRIRVALIAALLCCCSPWFAHSEDNSGTSEGYKALACPAAPSSGTWAILDRDGANREVRPYLSSLGGGERGTGVFTSPPLSVSVDVITFTICGHDGQGGGRGKNFIALIDANSGETLEKTAAPCTDPMQERSWDVSKHKGRDARIEVHDGLAEGAFAWIGVGMIDAGPSMAVDFRTGMPEGWKSSPPLTEDRMETVEGGVPFLRRATMFTMVPATGVAEVPCGFSARRLFFLGCTVPTGRPLDVYGSIEIVYRDGMRERFPLMYGFTLDAELKLLYRSGAMHLHPSGDPFQHYLVLKPRAEVIETIRLDRNPEQPLIPRITAITCETAAGDNLLPLPDSTPGPEERAWIESHAISSSSPDMERIVAEIRRAYDL